jgi:DNA repair protein RadA/Sms
MIDMKLGIGQPKLKDDTNILDIDIPKEMENAIPTGHAHIDRLFCGDGIIAGTVTLVTGDPGAGKSTLMVSLADRLTKNKHQAIYVTGEESLYQVRRVTKRLDLRHGFIPSYEVEAQEVMEHCERLRKKNPDEKLFLFIDSLQCLRVRRDEGSRGRPMSDEKQAIAGLQMLTEYAKNNWIPLFVIGHVNKKGEFAGRQTIKHIVDCHLHLSVDVDPDSGMEERVLEMKKNRFGASGVYYAAEMTAKGLIFEADTSSFAGGKV